MFGANLKKPAMAREIILATLGMVISVVFTLQNFVKPRAIEAQELTANLSELTEKVSGQQKLNNLLRDKKRKAEAEAAKQNQVKEEPEDVNADPLVQLIKHNRKQRYSGVSEFLQDISSTGFKSTVVIDSVKYDPKQVHAGYVETRFNLVIHGDYAKVLSFIKKLENVPALVSLQNISMNVSEGETQNVAVSLTGAFYQLEGDNV